MDHKHGVEAWRAILKARSHVSLAILLCKLCSSYHWWDWLLFDSHMFSPSLPWFVYLARFMMILCFRLTSDRAYKVSVSRLQFRYQNLCDFSSVYIESSPHILKWTTIFDGNAMDDFNLFWPASQFASRLSFDKERNGKCKKLHLTLFAISKKNRPVLFFWKIKGVLSVFLQIQRSLGFLLVVKFTVLLYRF